jgi:UDP-3-O-[3-hydroxymyristoyl] glucosamine N-acyltransferase
LAHRLADLAELVEGRVVGDHELVIQGLNTLELAEVHEISFVSNPGYKEQALESRAGALLVGEEMDGVTAAQLVAEDPRFALSRLLDLFHPEERPAAGVHPTAVIDPEAEIDPAASIGAFCVVGARSAIGAGALLHSHVVVGRECSIGQGALLHPRVVLYDRCDVGPGAILHSGVVLGSDGYGFATHGGEHVKLRHMGRTIVEAEVEIGANCTIDRALFAETRIGAGTKIDNLVQVGHNARIGRGCLLVSQVGISGSTRLGDGVVMAGQSGAAGHLELGDGSRVAAKSAVFKSVPAGETVAGIPAIKAGRWKRSQALFGRLGEIRRRLIRLEKRVDKDVGGEDQGERGE